MKRRAFIAAMGGAAVWPIMAVAQEPGRTYRLGSLQFSPRGAPWHAAFFEALRRQGFVEGQRPNNISTNDLIGFVPARTTFRQIPSCCGARALLTFTPLEPRRGPIPAVPMTIFGLSRAHGSSTARLIA